MCRIGESGPKHLILNNALRLVDTQLLVPINARAPKTWNLSTGQRCRPGKKPGGLPPGLVKAMPPCPFIVESLHPFVHSAPIPF
jgi:hypothetical protein